MDQLRQGLSMSAAKTYLRALAGYFLAGNPSGRYLHIAGDYLAN
jgi:hypothetical protein